jgi:hypothetical protein
LHRRLAKWVEFVESFPYIIKHKKGKDNIVADALSRKNMLLTQLDDLSMDFIDGLPPSRQYNCILVVVDKLSKYAHFVPLKLPYTATKVAEVFVDNIYKLHGMPLSLVSDRDPVFTSQFWQAGSLPCYWYKVKDEHG